MDGRDGKDLYVYNLKPPENQGTDLIDVIFKKYHQFNLNKVHRLLGIDDSIIPKYVS